MNNTNLINDVALLLGNIICPFKTLTVFCESAGENGAMLADCSVVRKRKACWPRWSSRKKRKNTVQEHST